MKVLVACCANDIKMMEEMLLPSLEMQNAEIDKLIIDNSKGKYKSAAEAYNKEIKNKECDIIIFAHQDFGFKSSNSIEKIISIFEDNEKILLGLAGMDLDGVVYSNLKYKNEEFITNNRVNTKLKKVVSLDECFFAIRKNDFDKFQFNEKVCDDWHLYVVELCYRMSIEDGYTVYVYNEGGYHKKNKPLKREINYSFIRGMNKLCIAYKNKVKCIYAPCYIVNTSFLQRHYRFIRSRLGIFLEGLKK